MFGRGLNMRAAIVRYNLCAAIACHGLCDIVCYSMCKKPTRYNRCAAIVCSWLCYDVCYLMLELCAKKQCVLKSCCVHLKCTKWGMGGGGGGDPQLGDRVSIRLSLRKTFCIRGRGEVVGCMLWAATNKRSPFNFLKGHTLRSIFLYFSGYIFLPNKLLSAGIK